jgi:hypothetical protein
MNNTALTPAGQAEGQRRRPARADTMTDTSTLPSAFPIHTPAVATVPAVDIDAHDRTMGLLPATWRRLLSVEPALADAEAALVAKLKSGSPFCIVVLNAWNSLPADSPVRPFWRRRLIQTRWYRLAQLITADNSDEGPAI